jgi:GTPase involved in cell partitioning and DNA repair
MTIRDEASNIEKQQLINAIVSKHAENLYKKYANLDVNQLKTIVNNNAQQKKNKFDKTFEKYKLVDAHIEAEKHKPFKDRLTIHEICKTFEVTPSPYHT